MDLKPGPEYVSFREDVKSFLSENIQMSGKARNPARANNEELEWQEKLIKNGYAARTIPQEYGGYGAKPDVLKSRIIAEEFTQAKIPLGMANQGISMFVPTFSVKSPFSICGIPHANSTTSKPLVREPLASS